MADLPPLPPGFKLDQPADVPPLPPGFTLDTPNAKPPLSAMDAFRARNPMLSGMMDIGEGAAKFVSGIGAQATGDIAGLGGIITNQIPGVQKVDPAALREQLIQKYTYQPQSPSTTAAVAEYPGRKLGEAGQYLNEKVTSVTGNPYLGDVAGAIPAAAASWLGLKGTPVGGALGRTSALGRNIEAGAARGDAALAESRAASASSVPQKATGPVAPAVDLTAVNAERNALFAKAREKGLVVPPTAINPSAANTITESLAGKAMVRQQAMAINQPRFNQMVAEDLGLPTNQPLSRPAIRQVIKAFGNTKAAVKKTGTIASDDAYLNDITALSKQDAELESSYPGSKPKADPEIEKTIDSALVDSHTAESAVNYATVLRERAKANFQAARMKGGDSQLTALARTQYGVANALEELVSRNLEKIGKGDLAKEWEAGRIRAAKAYVAEGALRGNDVLASRLAQQLQKNKPLSGNFDLIAKFADQFEEVSKRPKSGVGVSKLGAVLAGGGMAFGHPGLAAVPIAGYAARRYIMGENAQNALAARGSNAFAQYARRENRLKDLRRAIAIPAYQQERR